MTIGITDYNIYTPENPLRLTPDQYSDRIVNDSKFREIAVTMIQSGSFRFDERPRYTRKEIAEIISDETNDWYSVTAFLEEVIKNKVVITDAD